MKFLTLITCLWASLLLAQKQAVSEADSLKNLLKFATSDKEKVMIYVQLAIPTGKAFRQLKRDELIDYAQQGYDLAKKIGFEKGQMECALLLGFTLGNRETQKAILYATEAMLLSEKNKDTLNLIRSYGFLGNAYTVYDYRKSLTYFFRAWELSKKLKVDEESIMPIYAPIGYVYKEAGILDSALIFLKKGYELSFQHKTVFIPSSYFTEFGEIYYKQGKYDSAMHYFRRSLASGQTSRGHTHYFMGQIKKQQHQIDSAKFYGKTALELCMAASDNQFIPLIGNFLHNLYKDTDSVQASRYRLIALEAKDKVYDKEKTQQIERIAYEEREKAITRERQIEAERSNNKLLILISSLLGVVLISVILYRNNHQKQKANTLLQQQKEEIDKKSRELEKSLTELKTTQNQLIQKEKLASLGELTAGIAHEIQNPLNFVNNFSELSVDLVKDLNEEIDKPDIDKEYVRELFTDLSQNQEKINHHGKRASSIVKGMLEHSRASTGVKELTDINKLADEYLRLSYHGLRAKDKDFNADFKTEFDENLPKINVIPQDMGRVLLNLINNAFYAVHQRKLLSNNENYTPSVSVTTKHLENAIEVRVKDNGTGMPESVKAKVFQPFFTTKPTGQGTGLGLSLAYDIVTKGHGGTMEVVSSEGVGSEFIITLPFKTT